MNGFLIYINSQTESIIYSPKKPIHLFATMISNLLSCSPLISRILIVLAMTAITGLSACSSSSDDPDTVPDDSDTLPDNPGTSLDDPLASDGLTEAQRTQLPEDCLLAFDSADIAYCFSEPTRKFTSVNPDGTANWAFSLPGDNASNHIEGIAVFEDQDLCIVADVTQTVGDSRHEVSCFELSGQFIATNPTLEPLPRLGDPVKPRDPLAINLDDESLLVAANNESLYLAGSEYLLTAGSDPSIRGSWSRVAGFIVRVDPGNGDALAWHSFPLATVSDITLVDEDRVTATIQSVDSTESTSLTLDADTLTADSGSEPEDVLNAHDLPELMPQVFAALTGKPLQDAEEYLLSSVSKLPIELYFGEDDFCTSFNEGLGCEVNYLSPPQTVPCPVSGSAILTASANSTWSSPAISESKTAKWLFEQCTIATTDTASDDDLVHSINGNWQYIQSTASGITGQSETDSSNFSELSLSLIDSSEFSADGELARSDFQSGRTNTRYKHLNGKINRFVDDSMEITDTVFGYHLDLTNSGYESDIVTIKYYGGSEQIGTTLTSQASSGEPVRVELMDDRLATGYAPEGVAILQLDAYFFIGSLYISANDGSNVLLTALESPVGLGTELLEYSLTSGGVTTMQRIPSASWYLPYQITGIDPFEYLYRDSDADGINDIVEGELDSDGDGTPDYLDTDSDNDGIPDATEGDWHSDEYSNNPDTIPNYLDDDSDGDTIPDIVEGTLDSDSDGTLDFLDRDSDGDSLSDEFEGYDDPDGDGAPNYLDEDSDGDGIRDSSEWTGDFDGDGIPDFLDEDSDNDGIPDSVEGEEDRDGDGRMDYIDPD